MARMKGDRTNLVTAKTKSDSLRTTVPSSIVKVMKLDAGDQFEWEIVSLSDKTFKVTVVKAEENESDY